MNLLTLPGRVSTDGKRMIRPFGADYCAYERQTTAHGMTVWQRVANGLTPEQCARYIIKGELPSEVDA